MADTIHTQPELAGELSTEELLKALKLAIDSFPPAHPDAEGMSVAQYEVTLELRKARAAIAADRAMRQPEPGEVQELVALIRQIALAWEPDATLLGNMTAGQLARAADLLERLSPPQPVPVSERPWEREGWCHPQERWAWFYNRRVGWRDAIAPESLKPPTLFPYTHSLPFNALPTPRPRG